MGRRSVPYGLPPHYFHSEPAAYTALKKLARLSRRCWVQHEESLNILAGKLLLRKHALIETILDQLKNISQIELIRRRNANSFVVNRLGGPIACCHQLKKPSLHLDALPRLMYVSPKLRL